MTEAIFDQILRGDAPATFVYRDELVSAFMDIQPVNPGRVLVVPNEPAAYLADRLDDCERLQLRVGVVIAEV